MTQEHSLFGEEKQWEKIGNIFYEIEQYFIKRLQDKFAGVANNPLVLRNSKNVPLYLLCFAVGNQKGSTTALKIAEHILDNQLHDQQTLPLLKE